MASSFEILVYNGQSQVYSGEFCGPVELGRQNREEEKLYSPLACEGRTRVPIASLIEQRISRKHLLLSPLADGRIHINNCSDSRRVLLAGTINIEPLGQADASPPFSLMIGGKTIRVQPLDEEEPLQSLPDATLVPGQASGAYRFDPRALAPGGNFDRHLVLGWLQATLDLLQSAASSSDFFTKAAHVAVELVGLDASQVLLLEKGEWKSVASHSAPGQSTAGEGVPSQRVLAHVRDKKRTFWQLQPLGGRAAGSGAGGDPAGSWAGGSLMGVQAVVAAPILDREGKVIGALYGNRRGRGPASGVPLTELEATLTEVLASSVAAGLARLEQERAALAARVQFEQFFTPELARYLADQPDLLEGRDAEVTLLFCDIRGFSRIAERMGPAQTIHWVSEVLESLSECVLARRGVLVNYMGDELLAMWGAPEKQEDHARLACRAALEMRARLPELNTRWQETVGEPIRIGIGINTGMACVGNMGSKRKFVYGPQGDTVNLASRVQGATRYLRSPILITGSTRERLDAEFSARRLCQVRVVNIARPVDLWELRTADEPGWPALKRAYEEALAEFEKRNFSAAARITGNLLTTSPDDGPSLVLLSRAVQRLIDSRGEFDPVWELPGK
jgi:adenylate cyclase